MGTGTAGPPALGETVPFPGHTTCPARDGRGVGRPGLAVTSRPRPPRRPRYGVRTSDVEGRASSRGRRRPLRPSGLVTKTGLCFSLSRPLEGRPSGPASTGPVTTAFRARQTYAYKRARRVGRAPVPAVTTRVPSGTRPCLANAGRRPS